MKLHTQICDRLGIRYPIFGLTHSVDVAVAIARAGAFPMFALGRTSLETAEADVARLRSEIGALPWGINCFLTSSVVAETDRAAAKSALPRGHLDFVAGIRDKYRIPAPVKGNFFSNVVRSHKLIDGHAEIALASGAPVLSTAAGAPQRLIERAKAAGMLTVASVGTPRHAQIALAGGIDMLVAQGYDAGGHTGHIGTFALVPQIVDAAQGRPVLAVGGIGTGRQIAAAFAMGAAGAWLGTAWLTATENHTDDQLLAKLLAAGSGDTVLTRAHSGKSARVLRSAWTDEWSRPDAPIPLEMPMQQVLTGELIAGIEEHRMSELRYELCGQSIAYFNKPAPVADIIDRLVAQTIEALQSVQQTFR